MVSLFLRILYIAYNEEVIARSMVETPSDRIASQSQLISFFNFTGDIMRKRIYSQYEFTYKSASAWLVVNSEGIGTLSSLESTKPGKGHATKLIKEVISFAKKKGLTLRIQAEQYHEKAFKSNEDLSDWYTTFGFVREADQPTWLSMDVLYI